MVNTEKSLRRDRTRLRRGQNPQQIDFKRMRKARIVGVKYWRLKRKTEGITETPVVEGKKDTKKEKAKKKEPELEVIDAELEEIYSIDDDEDIDDEELDAEETDE